MTLLGLGLTFVAAVVLPGLAGGVGLTAAADPAVARPGALAARCLASGVSAWLLVSGLLVRTIGITETTARVATTALAIASVAVLLLPRCRAVLRGAGGEAAYLAGLAAVALLAWVPIGILVWRTSVGTIAATPWFYWELARQILAEGTFPETSVEFATTVPYLSDYPLFSSGTAMMMAGVPASAQPAVLNLVTMLGVVTLGAGAALLAHTWGASRTASFVAVPLVVSFGVGGLRLLGYRPEGFALGLALLVVVLTIDWLRNRDVTSLAPGCVLGAVVGQVHGIALLGTALFLVAATLTLLAVERSWRLVRAAVLTGVALASSVGLLGLAMGRVSGSGTSEGIQDVAGTADPTWAFRKLARGQDPTEPPGATELLLDGIERLYDEQTWLVVVLVLAGSALLLWRARLRREAAQPVLFLVLGNLLVLAAGCVFVYGWDSYVPRRTGAQRLLMESTLLMPVFLACVISCAISLVARRRIRQLALGAAVATSMAAGVWMSLELQGEASDWRPDPADQRALASVELPADAVILANGYTEGYLHHVTGARGLLEGRAPYTFPELLDRALELFGGAKDFYADPVGEREFLDEHGVTHVVVARRGTFAITSDMLFTERPRITELRNSPYFEEMVAGPGLIVFKYVKATDTGD